MKSLELLKALKDYFGASQVITQTQLDEAITEIEALDSKINNLQNDPTVLAMEQRLIDIGLVLEGKLTSKE